jgi:Domain of unknown function (DUF4760)
VSAEWIGAVSSAATFVVIAASAIAALIQLRHARTSNQIAALNEIRERLDSPVFAEVMRFIRAELPERLKDPEVRRALLGPSWFADVPEEYRRLAIVANYFESLGLLVKLDIVDARIINEIFCNITVDLWESFGPLAVQRRIVLQLPQLWENFEYLAVRAREWMHKHPNGAYPRDAGRWSFPLWPETEGKADEKATQR